MTVFACVRIITVETMSKRLELVWPEKDKILLGLDDNGKPIWGTKADLETRLLVQLEDVGETNPDNLNDLYDQGDNLLIKGDNLLALKALERHFAGKIKCIYIDPPFNTGGAFEHYEDGYEQTVWLSLMRDRLQLLRDLLRLDGFICVHSDDTESAYLRVMMDEIFGAENWVTTVFVQARYPSKTLKADRPFHMLVDQVHVYRKSEQAVIKQERKEYDISKYVWRITTDSLSKTLVLGSRTVECFDVGSYSIERSSPSSDRLKEVWISGKVLDINSSGRFFRDHLSGRVEEDGLGVLYKVYGIGEDNLGYRYITGPKREGAVRGKYYQGIPAKIGSEPQYRIQALLNLWDLAASIGNCRHEGGADFRSGKKPEVLVYNLLNIFTEEDDWVLDSFLGSGTTAAVAHKMNRRWIGVEIGEHAETLCLPRLKRVVSGKDQTGISKHVGWKGGGGFRYCVLGESLFAKDKDTGLVMLNPKYTNGPLVSAICNLEGFHLNNDSLFQGVRGNAYAHITEDKVTQTYVDSLVEKLPKGKTLVIYCLKRAAGLDTPQEVKVKRIPRELQIPRYLMSTKSGGGK
jgi:adenine-specific DNA-methyltransferase